MIQFIKNHPVISFSVLIIALLVSRIIYVQLNQAEFNISMKGITVSKTFEWLSIIYDENIVPEEIIDYSIFYGLSPTMHLEEFDSLFGTPFNIREENETINFYEYRTKIGEVIVCDGYEKLEEGIEPIRYLKIKPINISIDDIFYKSIANIIRDNNDILKVSIMKKNQHYNFITVQIKNNFIDSITWYE